MSKTNQITNAGALKLQHASAAQLQTRAATVTGANTGKNTSTQVQFADILHKACGTESPRAWDRDDGQSPYEPESGS